ncbi:HAMP domain-containing protein [Mycolicibacterium sp. CH28]|uniref:adenylate/guanylate cyclase domain-containing protein n=1 Tax=Mycolicibacterium sp. CH28 TaxID=2512237 RepID=UPI00108226E9|nr:adenylate/guanylate cyclase domain-containing protein [Mycolicibacterium sp. CH28]TGD88155.1 HAMP domain-containing protein [Mycolicibacterium sp. CH28]
MLLAVSVISVLTAGAIGYASGTASLRNAEYQRLTQLRESRAREIKTFYTGITDAVSIVTHGTQTVAAVNDFGKAFDELQKVPLPPDADQAVANYDATVFGPELAAKSGKSVDATLFKPTSNAQTYLQYYYTVPARGDYEAAIKVITAGDPSAWSAINARYQPFFGDLTQRFSFDDALMMDTQGNIVYTAYKGVDLGANLFRSPYNTTALAETYRQALQSTSIDQTFVTDFERYAPSFGRPIQWVLSPIGRDGVIVGVLALQISLDQINDVMTGQGRWVQDGLGQSGETYLAGPDKLMRSVSRELLTDPKRYVADVMSDGTPDDIAERQVAVKGSTLLQPVDKRAVNEALAGRTGVTTAPDYVGPEALVAYAPLDIDGLDWVLVAKIDKSEALAPVATFARNIALSTAAIVLVVCLLALLFSRILTRPIKRLAAAVRRVAGGELGVSVPVTATDEIGELASAFNDMSASLQTKQQLIEDQRKENDELLASLMPEALARRYREGEENISTHYRDVSVIYAQLLGFDDYSRSMPKEESVAMLNSLAEAFDEAAERNGVERVRSMQDNGLLATCGVVVPRVDHASRTIAFANELTEIVQRFNDQHDARLAIRAGIDSGPVTSGLVGQRSKIYALWGEAVDLANRVHAATKTPGVFVSDRVHEAVVGIYSFSDAGTVSGAHGAEPVWRLDVGTRLSV